MSDVDSNFFDRFPNWLRWLFLPFVVIAIYVIATAVIGIFFWLTRVFIGASDDSWMGWAHYYIIQPAAGCYVTVLIGSFCAPSQKFATSLILGGLFAILNGMGIMVMTELGFDFGMLTAFFCGTLGAGIAVFKVKEETI